MTSSQFARLLLNWRVSLAWLACAVLLWFAWLFPLVPASTIGWIISAGLGAALAAVLALSAFAILWLGERSRYTFLAKATALVLAISIGVAIFGLAYWQQAVLRGNFSYFGAGAR